MMHGDWGFGGSWLIMLLFWFLMFSLSISVLASLFHRSSPSRLPTDRFDPRQIVQERYAKGEISRDEYLTLMNDFK